MKLSMDSVKGAFKLVGYKLTESRPEIALVAGVVSLAAGTIWACVKTKEAIPVVEDLVAENDEQKLNEAATNEGKIDIRERARIYGRYAIEFAKIYGLPFALWVLGIGCIVGSHGEMRQRNARLLADSVALKKLFDEYRERVREAVGEEIERKLYFGADVDDEEIEVIEKDEETGKDKLVKKKASVFDRQPGSIYARNFTAKTSDEFNIRSYCDFFLEARIANLNQRLRVVPFITLNDVYDELGFKPGEGRCEDGMTVGWVWNPKVDRGDREIIVERLEGYEPHWDEKTGRTVYEPCLRLDFNCYPLKGLI